MTDRELLELAAKAAGIAWNPDSGNMETGEIGATGMSMMERWNPLENDGDALRLLVAISVKSHKSTEISLLGKLLAHYNGKDKDPDAATRRAIVEYAARFGKRML